MLVQNYGAMMVPTYFQKILDEITGANRAAVVWQLIGMACLWAGITVVSLYGMRRLIIGASRTIEYSLRRRIHSRLLELDYAFFQAHETGDLVSRTTNDLDNVRTLLGPRGDVHSQQPQHVRLLLPRAFPAERRRSCSSSRACS